MISTRSLAKLVLQNDVPIQLKPTDKSNKSTKPKLETPLKKSILEQPEETRVSDLKQLREKASKILTNLKIYKTRSENTKRIR